MAGLGATLNCPGATAALTAVLGARGPGTATCRLVGAGGAVLDLAVRAVIPTIPRVVGAAGDLVAAFAVDGVASVTQLDARYTAGGPAGLVLDADPYAVILADAEICALVLACGGAGPRAGPGLYYARLDDGWIVASEPAMLIAAGVPAGPDPLTVARFVATGACDEGARTFFAGIRRVLPGQAVTLTPEGMTSSPIAPSSRPRPRPGVALREAVDAERLGIRLTPGLAGAALLGAALARPDRRRPLSVHSAVFPGLGGAFGHTPAVLVPLPFGTLLPATHPFDPCGFLLDEFLRDMGEPVPDLDAYLLWEIARRLGGDVGVLVDATATAGATDGWLARLADRIAARHGVEVRSPLRTVGNTDGTVPADTTAELQAVATRTLPAEAAHFAENDSAAVPGPAELLRPLRTRLAATFMSERFATRPWGDREATLGQLRQLCAGRPADASGLLRRYLVERWLAVVVDAVPPGHPAAVTAAAVNPLDVSVGRTSWCRVPVRTEVIGPGDPLAAKAAWHAAAHLEALAGKQRYARALRGPWLLLLAAKPVAVSQRRINPLWEVEPGWAARLLSALLSPHRLGDPWTMQVAIGEGGLARVAAGALAGGFGLWRWYERLMPPGADGVIRPRADAVEPADSAVVRGPWKPDEFAASLVDAVRLAVPPEQFATLAGCAVVEADATAVRVLGFSGGPNLDAVADPVTLVRDLCADNPAGQGTARTPLVLAMRAPRRSAADHDLKPAPHTVPANHTGVATPL